MEAPKNPQQQGYYPLQEQITYSLEQEYPPQEEHIPKERYENVTPSYPLGQQQPYIPSTQSVPVTQHQTSNVVAVQSQPTAMSPNIVIHPTKDHYLTLSIVLTFICLFVGLPTLLCTIPAIIYAIVARRAERHGDLQGARFNARSALILNIVAFVVGMIGVNYLIMLIVATIADDIRQASYYRCNDKI